MKEAVIVAACRTAVGRAPRGTLRLTRPEYLGTEVVKEVIKRTPGLDPIDIDDVVMGCSFPEAEQGMNLARVLIQKAGLPDDISGITINRFCSSGLNAISMAAERIMVGAADCLIAGGVESMSMVPMGGNIMAVEPDIASTRPWDLEGMGFTAENVAKDFGIAREDQDAFAVQSNERAIAAIKAGKFKDEILPVMATKQRQKADGSYEIYEEVFDTDECPRGGTIEGLAKLRPAFMMGGSVTAGNSSQTSDGAAAVMLMTKEKAKELGLKPLATYRGFSVGGVPGKYMGIGPVKAIPKVLKQTGMTLDQMDLIELNEAFASQALYCIRELGVNTDIANVNGGAIALGHPLGCTGAKLTTQLLYEMNRRGSDCRFGLVSMCIGLGMGAAGIFEKEDY